jgi:hypothetical protein
MTGKRLRILSRAGLTVGLLAASYPLLWRRWCLTWGATPDEATAALRGDEVVPHADLVTTRAIAIDATPERIWPWLVQMGSGRAGSYTYDWLENLFGLDMHSAEVILPQFLDLTEGDEFAFGPVRMRVAALEPDHLLATWVPEWNWVRVFRLVPDGQGTRLVMRNRIAYPRAGRPGKLRRKMFAEPAGLLMESKMLRGIRARAEGDERASELR